MKSEDPEERIAALQEVDDQEVLQWHGQFDSDWKVRTAAIKRVTDEHFLANFVLDRKYGHDEQRLVAVAQIRDQSILAAITTGSRIPAVQNAALEKLVDDEQLAIVASTMAAEIEQTQPDELRSSLLSRAINKIGSSGFLEQLVVENPSDVLCSVVLLTTSDQSVLAALVEHSSNPIFRYRAAARISTAFILDDLTANNSDWGLRLLALDRTTHQSLLAQLATNDPLWIIRRGSLNQLSDPDLLLTVALESKDYDLACDATARLSEDQIASVATNAADWGARKSATARLEDKDALASIALNDSHWAVRSEAIDRTDDTVLLESIALNAAHSPDRLHAFAKITDPEQTLRILQSSEHDDIKLAAISKVEDQEILTGIAVETDQAAIGVAAVGRIDDPDMLSTIARDAANPRVRTQARILLVEHLPPNSEQQILWAQATDEPDLARAAIQRLSDQDALLRIARNDGPDEIRDLAISRITERDALLNMAFSRGPTHYEHGKSVYARSDTAGLRWVELTPPDQLARLLTSSANSTLIEAVIAKIEDQSVLENLAFNEGIEVAWTAVKHLNDAAALQRIVLNGAKAMGTDSWARDRLAQIAQPGEAIEFLLQLGDPGERGRFAEKITDVDSVAAIVRHPDLENVRQRVRAHMLNLLLDKIRSTDELKFATEAASETGPAAALPTDDEATEGRCRYIQFEAKKRMLALQPELAGEMDQDTFSRIVAEQTQEDARAIAIRHLSDYETLKKVADYDPREVVQAAAISRIHDQTFLEDHVDWANRERVRLAAARNLTNPSLLLRLATSDPSPDVREVARDLVFDRSMRAHGLSNNPIIKQAGRDDEPEILLAAAAIPHSLENRMFAALANPDDGIVQEIAKDEPYAYARRRVLRLIDNERFLFVLAQQDPSATVSLTAIEAINDPVLLAAGATDSDRAEVREAFEKRLREVASSEELTSFESQIESAKNDVADQISRIENELSTEHDIDQLVELASTAPRDILRLAAIKRISGEKARAEVVLRSRDPAIIRFALQSIVDEQLLRQIAKTATEKSARHAAAILAGKANWEELFRTAILREAPPTALLTVLSARTLLPPQSGTSDLLHDALRSFIYRADEATVAMLEEIIDSYGTVAIAEDYYNCGHPDLKRSASLWAHNHGYRFQYTIGNRDVRW